MIDFWIHSYGDAYQLRCAEGCRYQRTEHGGHDVYEGQRQQLELFLNEYHDVHFLQSAVWDCSCSYTHKRLLQHDVQVPPVGIVRNNTEESETNIRFGLNKNQWCQRAGSSVHNPLTREVYR